MVERSLQLVIVMHGPPDSNSALHAQALAARAPERVSVAIRYPPFDDRANALGGETRCDAVIAWTPRENVRAAAAVLVRRYRCPCLVHLEDNEDAITAAHLCVPYRSLRAPRAWIRYRHLRNRALSHPFRMRRFLRRAAGVTVLLDRLAEQVPRGVPVQLFWPGYDADLFDPLPPPAAGPRDGPATLVYTGNVHPNNAAEMLTLYEAVALLNRRGSAVRLLRSGACYDETFAERAAVSAPYVTECGVLPRRGLPALLARADVLVQPGAPGPFNDFRFPSKLPEFLVSGRPVILPATNLGRFLKDGEEAVLLHRGTAEEIADRVGELLADRDRARRIGAAGRAFARQRLTWTRAADAFFPFVLGCIGKG